MKVQWIWFPNLQTGWLAVKTNQSVNSIESNHKKEIYQSYQLYYHNVSISYKIIHVGKPGTSNCGKFSFKSSFRHVFLWFTSISRLPLLFFFTVHGFTLQEITLSIKKDDNLAKGVFSIDSITINLDNSVISLSELDFEGFCFALGFLFVDFYMPYVLFLFCFFHWSCALPHTIKFIFCKEFTKRDTHSLWLRWGYFDQYTRVKRGISSQSVLFLNALVRQP